MSETYAVVLAAGKGTRMKSKLYKVLHPVCGKPMVQHVVDTVQKMNPKETILVVGHGAEQVQETLGTNVTYVLQEEQLGTGHAVKVAKHQLENKEGTTIILYGDTPLITKETLEKLVQVHEQDQAAVTILTTHMEEPFGYGRIVRDQQRQIVRIVEQKDASTAEQAIKEINTGIYCFSNKKLMESLDQITNNNAQGEYYITDCIEILVQQGDKISSYVSPDSTETMGVNDRVQLAEAERYMRLRINQAHMRNGVTIINPEQTYIGPDVKIGADTIIHPGTILSGQTKVGEDCIIGPQTELRNMLVGDRTTIQYSILIESEVGHDTTIGPYAYVRPGSTIGSACKVGDFVEIKNSSLGDGSKVPHLSYIGDAEIGQRVNMGCGSITVNYDGEKKHKTVVEDGAFVGCNVNLIAPVTIGENSYVAAGSTINRSTPENSLAIAREKQVIKENYATKLRKNK